MEVVQGDIDSQNGSRYDEDVNLKELDEELKYQKKHQVQYLI